MAINLNKASNKKIDLTKHDATLQNVKAILWWTAPNKFPKFDLDVSAFCLANTEKGPKLVDEDWFIFYNNEQSPNKAIVKTPDEKSGGTEELTINIASLLPSIEEISLVVTIHKATERGQNFGQIEEAGIKIVNADTNEEIAFYDLDADYGSECSLQVGSFFKSGTEFSFQAIGVGYNLELGDFVEGYTS
jgi:tellurium resistance protein TerD